MAQLFFMTNLFLKFQTCNLIFVTDTERDEGTSPKQDAPFFKVGGQQTSADPEGAGVRTPSLKTQSYQASDVGPGRMILPKSSFFQSPSKHTHFAQKVLK